MGVQNSARIKECPGCGELLEGSPYNVGMVKGILNFTKNSGTPCSQTIECSALDASSSAFAQISIEMQGSGEPQSVAFDTATATLILECGTAGSYVMVGYPDFPLTSTINCEC